MIDGVRGRAVVALHSCPLRRIATKPFSRWIDTLRGFAPVTRRRSVTFEPAGTAPNGVRYLASNESWNSFTLAAAAGAAGTTSTAAASAKATRDPIAAEAIAPPYTGGCRR